MNQFSQITASGRALFEATRRELHRRFPAAFPYEKAQRRALSTFIVKDLVQQEALSASDASRFLEVWCNRPRYLFAVAKGGDRIDLFGNPVMAITEAHRAHARYVLRRRNSTGARAALRALDAGRHKSAFPAQMAEASA